jgi:hypothetical protein
MDTMSLPSPLYTLIPGLSDVLAHMNKKWFEKIYSIPTHEVISYHAYVCAFWYSSSHQVSY